MRAFKWIPRGSDKLSMDIFLSSSRFRVKIKLQTHDYHTNDFFYHHHMQPIAFGRVTKLNKCQGVNLELFSQRLQEYWSSRVKWDLLCEGWSTSYAATPMVKRTSLSTLLSIYSVLFLNTSKFYHTLYSCIGAIEKVLCPLQICHTSMHLYLHKGNFFSSDRPIHREGLQSIQICHTFSQCQYIVVTLPSITEKCPITVPI